MEKVLYAELLAMCIFVSVIVWYNDVKKSRGPLLKGQKIFRILLWTNIVTMVCDVVQVVYNGTMFPYSNLIENISIFIYYLLHPAMGFMFALYVDFELYPDNERFKKVLPFYTIPEIISLFMCIGSIWNGWYYVIDERNCYQRGSLFYVPTVITFGYILWVAILILYWEKHTRLDGRVQREMFTRLIVFPVLPWIGAVLQLKVEGTAVIFPCTTLALLFNYISMQDSQLGRDHLTGLYNRSQLELFINNQLKNMKKGQLFFLILLDMDDFKHINDTYGHVVGDDALICAANILRESCKRKEDYVARLGGDEFVIIGQCKEQNTVEKIVHRIGEEAKTFNDTNKKVYELLFSAGYTIYDGTSSANLDTLISEADHRMYEVKKAKKQDGKSM